MQKGAKVRKPTGSSRFSDSQKESRSLGLSAGHLVRMTIAELTPPMGRLM